MYASQILKYGCICECQFEYIKITINSIPILAEFKNILNYDKSYLQEYFLIDLMQHVAS